MYIYIYRYLGNISNPLSTANKQGFGHFTTDFPRVFVSLGSAPNGSRVHCQRVVYWRSSLPERSWLRWGWVWGDGKGCQKYDQLESSHWKNEQKQKDFTPQNKTVWKLPTWSLTVSFPLQIYQNPIGSRIVFQQSAFFMGFHSLKNFGGGTSNVQTVPWSCGANQLTPPLKPRIVLCPLSGILGGFRRFPVFDQHFGQFAQTVPALEGSQCGPRVQKS